MNIDLSKIPFSRFGSYYCINWLPNNPKVKMKDEDAGLYLRTVHWDVSTRDIFKFDLMDGEKILKYKISTTPSVLRLEAPQGYVQMCFADKNIIRIKGQGIRLRMRSAGKVDMHSMARIQPDKWLFNKFTSRVNIIMTRLKGELDVDAHWDAWKSLDSFQASVYDGEDGGFEIALELYSGMYREAVHTDCFEACVEKVEKEFREFLDKTPEVPKEYEDVRMCAAFLNWACVVEPHGILNRFGMYMSKNWMLHIWSWDHCFNAISLSYKNPELAWDQLMVMFDYQDESGALPDCVDDCSLVWNFCKPPIHGWALKKMMENTDFIDLEKKKEIYTPLVRWTNWWFEYRDYDRDGIQQYNHGNDSGWDNSTIFRVLPPIESPDLAAFLIVQMDVLAQLANDLGKEEEALCWKEKADKLLKDMMDHFWTGNGFQAVVSGSHVPVESDSLILYMPLVLGRRLPKAVVQAIVDSLKNKGFLTQYGPATEAPLSKLYEGDGYWRGPIWAPSTMLLADGLRESGEEELAREVAQSFIKTVSISGFAENFNALTGQGLRDPAYTWTSSVFLILAHEYLKTYRNLKK